MPNKNKKTTKEQIQNDSERIDIVEENRFHTDLKMRFALRY